MQKLMFHNMANSSYIGMVTVLDYEISLRKCLQEMSFPPRESMRKIIVDLALKCGMNQYRFVVFDISAEGKVIWNSSEYIVPDGDIVNAANKHLKDKCEIVSNSMLSAVRKKEILRN